MCACISMYKCRGMHVTVHGEGGQLQVLVLAFLFLTGTLCCLLLCVLG